MPAVGIYTIDMVMRGRVNARWIVVVRGIDDVLCGPGGVRSYEDQNRVVPVLSRLDMFIFYRRAPSVRHVEDRKRKKGIARVHKRRRVIIMGVLLPENYDHAANYHSKRRKRTLAQS